MMLSIFTKSLNDSVNELVIPDSLNVVLKNDTLQIMDLSAGSNITEIILSVVIAIAAVFALLLPFFREWYHERKRLNGIKKYFFDELSSIIKAIDEQITNFEVLSQKINDLKVRNFPFKTSPELVVENLKKVPHLDLYNILVTKGKGKTEINIEKFKNITNTIEFINKQIELGSNSLKIYIDDLRRYESSWQTNLKILRKLYDEYMLNLISNKINISNDSFLNSINTNFSNWIRGDKDIESTKTDLINPVKEHSVNHLPDRRAYQILSVIHDIVEDYDNIINLRKIYSELFDEYREKLNARKDLLIDSISHFKTF